MLPSNLRRAVISLHILLLPLVQGQFVASLPQCVQNCINQSQDDNCSVSDVACLCRASAGNFLPDLITCIHGNCDNDLDNNLLLTPLQYACELASTPLPESAIRNAENQISSLAMQVTTTVTQGSVTLVETLSTSVTTTTVTTTQGGSTLTLIYPITLESIITQAPPTPTTGSGSGFTGVIPVVITTTDSAGSTFTTTSSEPGAISTFTTTDSSGNTVTDTSTYTQSSAAGGGLVIVTTTDSVGSTFTTTESSSTTSASTTTTLTTSVAAAKTSSSGRASSKTASAPGESSTNSSPYLDTNNSGNRERVGNWLGLSVLLAVGILWL